MIDIKEIDEEIHRLENSECTTYKVCDKLAALYIVKHYFQNMENEDMGAASSADIKSPITSMSMMAR